MTRTDMSGDANQYATIHGIGSYLPPKILTNEQLSLEVEWTADQILQKTGIAERRIAASDETVSDMATAAAQRLINDYQVDPSTIQFLILCTQTPDHFLPATACIVQERLGLSNNCAAFDINQGCSGYIYSLGVAKALITSGMFNKGLVITAETYSKFINPRDRSTRTLFGDAATATLVKADREPGLEQFTLGTDGKGAKNLIVQAGAGRLPHSLDTAKESTDSSGNVRSLNNLYMNGPEIFTFSMKRVPQLVQDVLEASGLEKGDINWFVFHQANKFMLDSLRVKIGIPLEKMYTYLSQVGNTVSSTIPLALQHGMQQGHITYGQRLLLVGFGVGYSWGATILRWSI